MSDPGPAFVALMERLARTLDDVRTYSPENYRVSLVLCDVDDASATIILGEVDERLLVAHIQATIDDPGARGSVNAETGYIPQPQRTN